MQLASSEDDAELCPTVYRHGDHLQEAQLCWLLRGLHSKAIFLGWWLKWPQWGLGSGNIVGEGSDHLVTMPSDILIGCAWIMQVTPGFPGGWRGPRKIPGSR